MKDFKNSTRTQYMKGGACDGYAKGGSVKGAAKIAKVMGEFKRGELHSGSKKGPEVTSQKQATAIALSEARKAGAKIPQPVQKKSVGGVLKAMSPAAALLSSDAGQAIANSGLIGGILGGPLLASLMKKKQDGTITPAENQKLMQAQQAQPAQTGMKKGGPVKKAIGGAMPARAAARAATTVGAKAPVRKTVAPARGPSGAGFAAKPMVGKSDLMNAMANKLDMPRPMADRPVGPQPMAGKPDAQQPMVGKPVTMVGKPVAMVSGPPPMMKKGGLAAMPKGKKC